MSEAHRYLTYLEDILEAAETGVRFVEGTEKSRFMKDKKSHFATVRALEIIGEASKRIPSEIRQRYPDIAWDEMARMRDKLIHHYTKVNLEVVWRTASTDLPILSMQIRGILNELKAET